MGASAREIERQIKETRERIDANLNRLERRATSNATRYGIVAAVGLGLLAAGGVTLLVLRRRNRPRTSTTAEPGMTSRVLRQVVPAVAAAVSTALVRRIATGSRPTHEETR